MCVAIPGKVVEICGKDSLVEFGRIKKRVNTSLIENLKMGDYVLIHAGCAIEKIDEQEALETLSIFKSLIEEL